MLTPAETTHEETREARFDVICAGEALWKIDEASAAGVRPAEAS